MGKRYPFNGFETMASGYTNGLYLPTKPLDEWNIDECRRALCKQANGDVMRCLECESPCRYGRRIAVLLAPPEKVGEETKEKATDVKKKRGEAMVAAKKRKSEIKFMQMIASGNPKAYLEAHGMEIRNNMDRVKRLYAGVTQEDARKRLAEMGVEVEGVLGALVAEPVQEQATLAEAAEQAERAIDKLTEAVAEYSQIAVEDEETVDKLPEPKPEPVKNEGVKLLINSLSGKYFMYTREAGKIEIYIDPNPVCIANADDVDAICAEIKAAFEMMA